MKFKVKALNSYGKTVDIEIDAEDRGTVLSNLRTQGFLVIEIIDESLALPPNKATAMFTSSLSSFPSPDFSTIKVISPKPLARNDDEDDYIINDSDNNVGLRSFVTWYNCLGVLTLVDFAVLFANGANVFEFCAHYAVAMALLGICYRYNL